MIKSSEKLKIFYENQLLLKKLNKIAYRKPFERPNDVNNVEYRKRLTVSQQGRDIIDQNIVKLKRIRALQAQIKPKAEHEEVEEQMKQQHKIKSQIREKKKRELNDQNMKMFNRLIS